MLKMVSRSSPHNDYRWWFSSERSDWRWLAGRYRNGCPPAAVYTASTYNCIVLAEISEGNGGLNLFARPDSDIVQAVGANPDFPEILGSADTLRGKDIIYGFGSMGQYGVTAYLDLFGLTTDDVNAINMNFGPGYQAFQAGEGDVVALFTPL